MSMIIAVEGGGTHTRVARYDAAGCLACEFRGGPSNPSAYGVDAAVRNIAGLVRQTLASSEDADSRLYAALAGVANEVSRTETAAALAAALPCHEVWVTSDLHALLYANAGNAAAILAIAGTGAAVLARDDAGDMLRTGGWGTLLGDEGSGYAVAVAALRTCARALDGVGQDTSLIRLLPAAAGLNTFSDFIGWSARASKKEVAALAITVARAAESGDAAARLCIETEAGKLAALAVSAQAKLGLPQNIPLFEYGSLLTRCSIYKEAFRSALLASASLRVAPCEYEGTGAVFRLSLLDSIPPWVAACKKNGGIRAFSLPDTETAGREAPLDALAPIEIARCMQRADHEAVNAVGEACEIIAEAIDRAGECLRKGGRIIYAGAGTSGRLGALDASECPPTFGVSPDRVVALVAGGERALRFSVEGAEDDREQGIRDARALDINSLDFVAGIAASGNTPYVGGVLQAAREAGACTALITSNRKATLEADLLIALNTGPEALPGSTRLKAGTAAKLVLNMISTGAFARAGFVYRGRMVGMTPVNAKLRERAARIVEELADITRDKSVEVLENSGYHIATALVMACGNLTAEKARARLDQHQGRLGDALSDTLEK